MDSLEPYIRRPHMAVKANTILLPLEVSLSADVTVMSEAISKEREKNNGSMPLIHGKALYQSYSIKALEVHEEMETVKSQDVSSTHTDLLQSDSSIEKDRSSYESREIGSQDLVMNVDVSLHDGCWISPPEHSFTSSSGCNTGLTQISSSDSLEKIDALMNDGVVIGLQANSQEKGDSCSNEVLIDSVASTRASIHDDETRSVEGKVEFEDSSVAIKQVRGQECDNNDPKSYSDSPTRATRGKTEEG
ncbi:hypothetical protein PR202_ga13393 [Eleusine coracana subsp. coracana]|uniref:Uncharacterized protein n=1 Tax=Eleusine coracana subsp. coracana TaxID=191504 RepID=A0AAV5CE22_ELECO|nr:hypothetical protein PR202_ga13393 [Eleusine coracana subsp. coracana]